MAESKSSALAVYSGPKFEILKRDPESLPALLAANFSNFDGINEFDMDRVGIPGGGGLAWSVPDLNGEPEAVPELKGIVLFHGDRRSYWQIGFDENGGGSPPDCSSLDGRTGTGIIRGQKKGVDAPTTRNCKTCPMSQWGSADLDLAAGKKPSNGQACTQRKVVFFLRQGDSLPLIIDLAPTSIKAFNQFMLRLTSKGLPCYGVEVGLKLRNETSNGGIKYSVVSPRLISTLSDADSETMAKVVSGLRPFFDKVGVVAAPGTEI